MLLTRHMESTMARDPFKDHSHNINESARGSFVITPNDGADLASAIRQITIGTTGGTITWLDEAGASHATGPLPLGTYPIRAHRIMSTGTSATGLTGWI